MPTHEHSIKVNILLQQQENGRTVASALEVPDCSVEENSREQAISSLRENLIKKLDRAEVISIELPMNQSQDRDVDSVNTPNYSWSKSIGIFKADPQFEDFQQEIQAYRDELDALNS
jgi:pullulanase/glycogen debranching enzyme